MIQIIISLLSFVLTVSAAADEPFKSAGCLMKFDGRTLMVRDVWSRKLSFPGGLKSSGETPEQTAQRELKEETGLNVQPHQELMRHKGFVLFHCTPLDPVFALHAISPRIGRDVIKLILPEDARIEVEEALFVDLETAPLEDARFPKDWELGVQAARAAPSQTGLEILHDRSGAPSPALQWGLKIVRAVQQWDSPIGWWIFRFFSFLGEEPFMYLLVPFFLLCYSPRFGAKLILLLLVTTLTNGIAKNFFQQPRPFDWDPLVQWLGASGFGLPSGHAQLSASYWLAIALEFKNKWLWALTITIVVLTALSRIYLGVHFPQDILVGWVMALIVLAGFHFWDVNTEGKAFLASAPQHWLYWGIATAVGIALRPHPETLAIVSVWFGALAGLRLSRRFRPRLVYPPHTVSQGMARYLIGMLGLFAIAALAIFLHPTERTAAVMIIYNIVRYIALGLWMTGAAFIFAVLISPQEEKLAQSGQ